MLRLRTFRQRHQAKGWYASSGQARVVPLPADFAAAADVLAFVRDFVAALDFHAVVSAELLFGAHGRREPAAIRRRFIDRFKPHRVIVPDAADLLAAGDVIRAMTEQWGPHPELEQRNFWNDVLIAVSCRRRGVVLLSRDPDHQRIAPFVRHGYSPHFPVGEGASGGD